MVTKGYAAPGVGRVFARARELCERIGETAQLVRVVLRLRTFYQVRGALQTARELGEQGVALAQHMPDDGFQVYTHMALAHPLFSLGEFIRSREHLERGTVFYHPQLYRSYAFSQGKDAIAGRDVADLCLSMTRAACPCVECHGAGVACRMTTCSA
jgi:hypothetical protein